MKKLLFVCTSNITRSPACEDLLSGSNKYETRSVGTSPDAIVHVSQELIDWADMIFVMSEKSDKHLTYLRENFDLGSKPIFDLDIPDLIYSRRDQPELLDVLKHKLSQYITLDT